MAIALVQSKVEGAASTTAGTVTFPSAATAGSLLIVLIGTSSLQTATAVTSGWTKDQGGSSSLRLHCYSKVAVGGETGFQWTGSVSQQQGCFFSEWSGISNGVLDKFANGSGTSVTSMSTGTTATTTAADEVAVTCVACGSSMSGSGVWTNSFTDLGTTIAGSRWGRKILSATGTQESTYGAWTTARTGNSTILTYKAGTTTTTVSVDTPGAITLTGGGVTLQTTIGAGAGQLTLTGGDVTLQTTISAGAGAVTFAGQDVTVGILATIGVAELLDTGATTDATSYTQATSGFAALSATPSVGSYVIVGIDVSRGDTTNVVLPSSITVAGVSLALVDQNPYKASGANQMGLAVYIGTGSWSGTGWDTGALGFTGTGCRIAAYQLTGTTGVVQSAKATWVTLSTTGTVTLPSATPASANSRTFAFGSVNSNALLETLDTDFTQLAYSAHSSPSQEMWAAWSAATFERVTSTLHGTGANAGGVSVELGAAISTGPTTTTVTPDPGAITLTGGGVTLQTAISADGGALQLAGQAVALLEQLVAAAGAITLTGQTMTTAGGGNVTVTPSAGAMQLAGQGAVLALNVSSSAGALTLTGGAVTLAETVSAAAGSMTLTGQAAVILEQLSASAGSLTLTGQTMTTAGGGNVTISVSSPGVLTLTGQSASLTIALSASSGAITLTGRTPALIRSILPVAGALQLAGQTTPLRELLSITAGALQLEGKTILFAIPPDILEGAADALAGDRAAQGTGAETAGSGVTGDLVSNASGPE